MVSQPHAGVHDLNQPYRSQELIFAGDAAPLAGQIDYPTTPHPDTGYPLLFVIQHALCTTRKGYEAVARLATSVGFAVFRWDKRGTGRSGSAGHGNVRQDTLRAYQAALRQPGVAKNAVVIYAQNEGTVLLGQAYEAFKAQQAPLGIILAGNMLDQDAVLGLDVPLHIVMSAEDWNLPDIYAVAVTQAHNAHHKLSSSYYIADGADRRLQDRQQDRSNLHSGAARSIWRWLRAQWPAFTSI